MCHSQNAGQNCIGIERLLVHRRQYDDLHAIFTDRVTKMRLGSVMAPTDQGYLSPVDCGAMISTQRFEGLEHIIRRAKATETEEEVQVEGGSRYEHVFNEKGCYFLPTLVGPATKDMEIAQKERESSLCYRCCPK